MHRVSGHPNAPVWKKGLFCLALLGLSAACGGPAEGLEAELPPASVPTSEQASEGAESVPPRPVSPVVTPWFRGFGGPQDDVGTGVAVDGAGNVSVVWVSTPRQDAEREPVEGERLALHLSHYAPDGTGLWTREFPRNRVDALRVVASPGGALFVTGNAFLYDIDFGLGAASRGFLVKFSEEDGTALWQRRVGQKVYASVADAEGGVLVLGEDWTNGRAPLLARYDAEGELSWSRRFDAVAPGSALRALALGPSGERVVAGRLEGVLNVDGRTLGAPDVSSLIVLAFDAQGRLVWSREARGADVQVSGVKVAADGGVELVGEAAASFPWGGTTLPPGAFVLALGPEAEERWSGPLACGASPTAPALALDATGQVVVLCGDTLSTYSAEGDVYAQRPVTPGACEGETCEVTGTGLAVLPRGGYVLTGLQRRGDVASGDQDAFVRLLAP
ncbi:PQQ-binding-like beta-propeller repeat protein [Archangium primigenium]|uniref:outer membrane protein assembly factor BamB family protein n=1 Tax=[Archangium] primigenium TaxID=2792470 RepID=UPI0019563EAE|nr:PQQ-binding-like beta-propeller repeat protein [Archangium primigenium]MBM7113319.1 PQQ-binding-like beta-propeller repeat protein [Archangium primigenium]